MPVTGADSDVDADAAAYADSVVARAVNGINDPDGLQPQRPVYLYKREFASVPMTQSQRGFIAASNQRRRFAQGGATNGTDASLLARRALISQVLAAEKARPHHPPPTSVTPPPTLTPWVARSRPPFLLPSIDHLVAKHKLNAQRRVAELENPGARATEMTGETLAALTRAAAGPAPTDASARRSTTQGLPPVPPLPASVSAGASPPRASNPHHRHDDDSRPPRLQVTPRTFEYLKTTPTPETSVEVVTTLSRVVMSHNRLTWERKFGVKEKTAKDLAAERRVKTLGLLEALAAGGPAPSPGSPERQRLEAGFECLAQSSDTTTGNATVALEALFAHLARSDIQPRRKLATGPRRGNVTLDQLIALAFDS